MSGRYALGLLEGTGVELEYMIVDRETLAVRPIADELLRAEAGGYESEVECGGISWSNELALHVVELKTSEPVASLAGLGARFQEHVGRINAHLAPMDAMLLPTAMHPWMDPHAEFKRWPHEYGEIYAAFDRIFDCRGHGWANLQSSHLNLSFADDEEFGRLHAALRLLLPILPALAASSPLADGRPTGLLDTRLDVYRANARRVPSVSGAVVPEAVFTRGEYEGRLLAGIYADLAPLDPAGVLRHEWVNARGAIARFDRGSIEIRVLDVQECPDADVAIAVAVLAGVRALVGGELSPVEEQRRFTHDELAAILWRCTKDAEEAVLDHPAYLRALGSDAARCTAGELWRALVGRTVRTGAGAEEWLPALTHILDHGCLARRILRALGDAPDAARQRETYAELARCLAAGELFRAPVR